MMIEERCVLVSLDLVAIACGIIKLSTNFEAALLVSVIELK